MAKLTKSDNHEELLRIYDENNVFLGEMQTRGKVHEKELFHREVALWVIDKRNNSVLLQKRSLDKQFGAGKLGVLAGHVEGDDSLLGTVKKEATEELGVDINYYEIQRIHNFSKFEPNNHCHIYHYALISYIPLIAMDKQDEEVERLIYMDYDFIKSRVLAGDPRFMIPNDDNHKALFKNWINYLKINKIFFIYFKLNKI